MNKFKKAIEKWGIDSQEDMMIEEMSELIKAILKYRRKPEDDEKYENVCEEIADVNIMLKQMKTYYTNWPKYHKEKMIRFNSLLEKNNV
jgi:NTP pyrophosphatase (non-canonical NTP hydrolase)